jgi:murein DD-endopeptidase MepM/ murein hydrolase activator NlpD
MQKGNIYIRFAALLMFFGLGMTGLCQLKVAESYPQGYFRNPLGIPMSLSANFGELRPNHWHMGLDLRTDQKENLPVYAAAEGYVAYVGVRPSSFGQFIIINHPNGYSTLYAHLNGFFPALAKQVQAYRQKQETWTVELELQPNIVPVRKGELIGLSGNTGGSQGPHLHFEIRDTETGRCLNPLLFGFPVQDEVPPNFTRLAMYDRNQSTYDQSPKLFSVKKTGNTFYPSQRKLVSGSSKVSFAIGAYDRVGSSSSPEGIYKAVIYFDERPVSSFTLDNIDYNETG